MAEKHLSNEEFFEHLGELFKARREKDHGTVYLTQKRLTYNTEAASSTSTKATDDPLWDLSTEKPLPIIVRATNGKSKEHRSSKVKLSTIVHPEALGDFYVRYAEVCKAGMSALKPRDRSRRKKDKQKKKKATLAADAEKKS